MLGMHIAPMAFGLVAACSPETLEMTQPQDGGAEPSGSSYTEPEKYELPENDLDQDGDEIVFSIGPIEFTIIDDGFDADDDGTDPDVDDRETGRPDHAQGSGAATERPDKPGLDRKP